MAALIENLDAALARRFPRVDSTLDGLKEEGLYFWYRPIKKHLSNGWVEVEGYGQMIMLGGYSYLGLLKNTEIEKKAKEAIDVFGTGTQGSPMLAGTLSLRMDLERSIAEFKQTDDAICFNSGYVANLAAISTLLGRKDVVISDKMNHASIVDGCLASAAKLLRFNHNDMDSLESRLKQSMSASKKLVVVDAVYSMDGDIANLPEIRALCDKYDASLMVDEAHSVGVIGKTGRGIEEHFNMPSDTIDIKMGTLSKAIPSSGGYIAASNDICCYLRHAARGLIYSGASSAATLASALAGLTIVRNDRERIQNLHRNVDYFKQKLEELGMNVGMSETAIVPVICGPESAAAKLARYCQTRKLFIHAVYPPIVPPGTARLRVSIMANHTREDLDYCIKTIYEGACQLGIV